MKIKQGDAYAIPIEIKLNDAAVDVAEIESVEFCIGSVRKLYPDVYKRQEYLRQPKLVIFDDCRGLIEDMQAIQADENNPNDCAKQPHEVTHSCDAIRYFCQSRSLPAEAAQEENCAEDEEELYSHFMAGGEISEGYLNY